MPRNSRRIVLKLDPPTSSEHHQLGPQVSLRPQVSDSRSPVPILSIYQRRPQPLTAAPTACRLLALESPSLAVPASTYRVPLPLRVWRVRLQPSTKNRGRGAYSGGEYSGRRGQWRDTVACSGSFLCRGVALFRGGAVGTENNGVEGTGLKRGVLPPTLQQRSPFPLLGT